MNAMKVKNSVGAIAGSHITTVYREIMLYS